VLFRALSTGMAAKQKVLRDCHIDAAAAHVLQTRNKIFRLSLRAFFRNIGSSLMALPRSSPSRFAVVVSEFNREYTDALLASAQAVLQAHETKVVRVPGAYEIPLQVQRLARTRKYAAVIALGVVWQGKTLHAQEILRAVTDGLMRIQLESDIPVIHEVLAVATEAEARARCMGTKLNRGREAAEAALAMAALDGAKGKG
jgi:6,7-dimethyl-8-ribityllumazine synthase